MAPPPHDCFFRSTCRNWPNDTAPFGDSKGRKFRKSTIDPRRQWLPGNIRPNEDRVQDARPPMSYTRVSDDRFGPYGSHCVKFVPNPLPHRERMAGQCVQGIPRKIGAFFNILKRPRKNG